MYQPRSFISTQLLRTNRNIQNAQWKWRTEVKSWRGYLMHGRVMYRYLQRLELMYTEKSPTRTLYAWTNGGYAPVHAVLCVNHSLAEERQLGELDGRGYIDKHACIVIDRARTHATMHGIVPASL